MFLAAAYGDDAHPVSDPLLGSVQLLVRFHQAQGGWKFCLEGFLLCLFKPCFGGYFLILLEMSMCAIGSINSHYFHIIGDKLINPIVGVYIPIIRIPIKRWDFYNPQKNATFDHGTCGDYLV